MPVIVRPFKKEDLAAFEPLEFMTKEEMIDPELAEAIEKSNLAVTGIRDGKVIGCGGVHPIDEDNGEMWLRLSKDCLEHKLDTLRWVMSGLKIIEEIYPFRQLNAVIKNSFTKGQKWITFFGFKPVQIIDDYVVYAKLVRD